jgi:biopolymer transport protein TolR
MSRRRASLGPMSQINVVPYIDVMLVLLVIFMVTAPMMNPAQIDLPSVGKSVTPPAAPLEVVIRKDNSLSLRDHSGKTADRSLSDRNDLVAVVRERLAGSPDRPVVISADKSVRYEEVIKVMDVLQQQQIKRVGLLVQSRGQ